MERERERDLQEEGWLQFGAGILKLNPESHMGGGLGVKQLVVGSYILSICLFFLKAAGLLKRQSEFRVEQGT